MQMSPQRMIGVALMIVGIILLFVLGFGIMSMVMVIVPIAIGAILFITGKPWPVNVIIIENRANNNYAFKVTKGRRMIEGGTEYYDIKGVKGRIKPPKYDHVIVDVRGKNTLLLNSPEPNTFVPMQIERGKIKALDEDMKFWFTEQLIRARKEFDSKSLIYQYLPFLGLAVVMVASIVVFMTIFQGMGELSGQISSLAEQNARLLDRSIEMVKTAQQSLPQVI